jgi:hypothetical protein
MWSIFYLSVVNISPTCGQYSTSVVNISPISVVNILPISVVNIFPICGQYLTYLWSISYLSVVNILPVCLFGTAQASHMRPEISVGFGGQYFTVHTEDMVQWH